jgi:hypothetical protein
MKRFVKCYCHNWVLTHPKVSVGASVQTRGDSGSLVIVYQTTTVGASLQTRGGSGQRQCPCCLVLVGVSLQTRGGSGVGVWRDPKLFVGASLQMRGGSGINELGDKCPPVGASLQMMGGYGASVVADPCNCWSIPTDEGRLRATGLGWLPPESWSIPANEGWRRVRWGGKCLSMVGAYLQMRGGSGLGTLCHESIAERALGELHGVSRNPASRIPERPHIEADRPQCGDK